MAAKLRKIRPVETLTRSELIDLVRTQERIIAAMLREFQVVASGQQKAFVNWVPGRKGKKIGYVG